MVPITWRASSFLEFFCFWKLPSQSKLNPNQIQIIYIPFLPSFFLCIQGQPEQCGSYHLLQSCFSFFVRLHGHTELFGSYHLIQSCFSFFVHLHVHPEPFGSCIILQSCSSFFFRLHGQPELFASDHLLQFCPTHFHHLASIFWQRPGAVCRGLLFLTTFSFPLLFFFCSPSCSIFFASYPQPFFPLFFSQWSSVCFKFLISKWTFLFRPCLSCSIVSQNE